MIDRRRRLPGRRARRIVPRMAHDDAPIFRIVPAPPLPILVLFGAVAGVLVFATGAAGGRGNGLLDVALVAIGVLVLAMVGTSVHGSQRAGAQITHDGVRLTGDLYGREATPWRALDLDAARVVDLRAEPALRPGLRTLGTGFPGYASGYFALRGGGRALCLVSDESRVVLLPTRRDFVYLLSLRDPAAFLDALRTRAPRA